jgi:predicted TIM-barrel fold metal-dependent hydrolase
VIVLAQGIPDLQIVIDHLGKPLIVGRGFEPWGSLLAQNLGTRCRPESDRWTEADIAPYVDHALERNSSSIASDISLSQAAISLESEIFSSRRE